MSGKLRLFEKLDLLNVKDGQNNTAHVQVCGSENVISMESLKKGDKITIGIPSGSMHDITRGKKIVALLLIDTEAYDNL